MLYERWRQIAAERSHEPALRELPPGRQWTFAEMAKRVEGLPKCPPSVVHPQGHSAEFVFNVLHGWRDKVVVCPLEAEQKPPSLPPPPAPCCHLKTTSATTGQPRQIAFRAEQLAADAENIVATMGLRPDWPNLGVISLAHSYGFSNLVLPLLLHGVPLILVPSPLPEVVRQASALVPALTLPAVPALWRTWLESEVIPEHVCLAISAGAPLSLALERAVFERAGLKIHNFYGSSECGGIAYDTTSLPRSDEHYAGTPMQNVQVSLNEDGCVCVTSRAVGETYWPEPDGAVGGGVFRTSDLGELKDGGVFLRGRLSDQINVAGRKVSPATIEEALRGHAAVRDCLVFGVPGEDAERTDSIVACIATAAPVTIDALRQLLLSKLPAWQVPREWWLVESLDTDERGKTSRAHWRKRFLQGKGPAKQSGKANPKP